jgi:hypothetical protein
MVKMRLSAEELRWEKALHAAIPVCPPTMTVAATALSIRLCYADRRIGTKRISTR